MTTVKGKKPREKAQIVFVIPEDLKRKFKSKLVLEGLTAKEWIIEQIKKYLKV